MNINVIRGGEAAFNSIVFPPPDNRLLSYFNENLQSAYTAIGDMGHRFISTVKNMYDKFNSNEALNASKLLMYQAGMHFNQNIIYPVPMEHLGMANTLMQNYIIAQPDVNKLYKQNMCYGYQDTYINPEPDTYGEDTLYYQLATDGMLQFDKTEDGNGFVKHYSRSDIDEYLSPLDKFSIQDTWHNVMLLISNGTDPTDPDGGLL